MQPRTPICSNEDFSDATTENKLPAGHQPSAGARLPRGHLLYFRTQPWIIFFIAAHVSGAPEPRRSGAGGAIVGFYEEA